MWFLTQDNPAKIFFIKTQKTTIGRKDCEIITFENDQSLSRQHAQILLNGDTLKISDLDSKYGTFVNTTREEKNKIAPNSEVALEDGDRILLGRFNSELYVHHLTLKPSTSMLDAEKKAKLSSLLESINVTLSNDFDNTCSHLTMSVQSNVTHKLLLALTLCKPVVNPKFWIAFRESYNNNQILPKYSDYLPKIKADAFMTPESVSLAINEERKKLFSGKTFIFVSSKEHQSFGEIVMNAGASKCLVMSQNRVTTKMCCAKNAIVIQANEPATQTQNESGCAKIQAELLKNNRRLIPDHEIGLAVMKVSTERFCNPESQSVTSLFFEPGSSQLKITRSKILAHNSDQAGSKKKPETIVINLESSDEDDVVEVNKENLPGIPQPFQEPSISIPETQTAPSATGTQYFSNNDIPETPTPLDAMEVECPVESVPVAREPDSVVSIEPEVIEVQPEKPEKPTNVRSTRNWLTKQSKESTSKRSEKSPSDLFNFTTCKTVSEQTKSSNNSDLFNFTNVSKHSDKKRKNSSDDEPGPSAEPVKKRNRVIDSDSDEELPKKPSNPSRKRPADNGGLFNFNTNFIKRSKKVFDESICEPSQQTPTFTPVTRTQTAPVTIPKIYEDDSCDKGVWLSKAMTSFKLCEIKTEPNIMDVTDSTNTEDFKPTSLENLFNIISSANAGNSTINSMVSKRKGFAKKNNFKPQSQIVATKSVKVEETIADLNHF